MSERAQPNRWRCLSVGCNPVLRGEPAADAHKKSTGHRVAKWPVRSAEGNRRARERNRTGYYDKYNVGAKSAAARGIGGYGRNGVAALSGEDFSLDNAGPFSD